MAVGSETRTGSNLLLWAPWLLGPAAWAFHQNATYAPTGWICEHGEEVLYIPVTVAALGIGLVGAYLAARSLTVWRRRAAAGEGREATRRRFMAATGLGICVLSLAGIIVESVPTLVLGACIGAT